MNAIIPGIKYESDNKNASPKKDPNKPNKIKYLVLDA